MAAPFVLGGITVTLHSGPPDVVYSSAGGATDVVLSGGTPVRMRHWSKELITVSSAGAWMATGLDALNWDAEHVLLCPKPKRMATMGQLLDLTLTSDPRPDVPVVAHALVGRHWQPAAVIVAGRQVTITPVPGADQYSAAWYPMFNVLCTQPDEATASSGVSWQIICREV